jgi:hypothetical protein
MKVKFKEDPREWRKTTLLTAVGVVIVSTGLRWRHVLPSEYWALLLAAMGIVVITAWFWPGCYRGFYRVSIRVGFYSSQALARVILFFLFIALLTPLSLILRLTGNDPLQLKRPRTSGSYWHDAKQPSSQDRLF